MRALIMGFSQPVANSVSKIITDENGNTKVLRLDYSDLAVLRWFGSFLASGRMPHINVPGDDTYYLIIPEQLMSDMPLLNCSQDEVEERLNKLVQLNVLKRYYNKDLARAFYANSEMFDKMVNSDNM